MNSAKGQQHGTVDKGVVAVTITVDYSVCSFHV